MQTVPDRRVQKTCRALHAALVAQIIEKGYDAISVQDILDASDIGRSTFYSHFSGKEELLRYGFDRLRLELAEQRTARQGAGDHQRFGFSLALLRHARSHHQLYRAMLGGRGSLVAQQQLRLVLLDQIRQELLSEDFEHGWSRELVAEYVASAFLGVLHYWLDKRSKLEPEAVDSLFKHLAENGLNGVG